MLIRAHCLVPGPVQCTCEEQSSHHKFVEFVDYINSYITYFKGLCGNSVGRCLQAGTVNEPLQIYQADTLGSMVYGKINASHGHKPTATYPFAVKCLL